MLIELAMRLNNNILDPNTNIFLFKGWTVLVSIADLALVIALIVIAFATMLDSQTYGMKKALPRLIIVALLVNFSLVIPGVFMDISGMVTEFFLVQSGLAGDGISSVLASAFDISGFLETQNSGPADIAKAGKVSFQVVGSLFFVVVFTMIGSIILLTMAIMLFIRFFMLTFMLALTPVIFVAWIFPATRGRWDKWWNDFIRWTMFSPVMIFFVWLSLISLNSLQGTMPSEPAAGTAAYAFKEGMMFGLGPVIQMAMAIMFMTMSLIAANGISISGAKGGKDMIGSLTNWGRGRIDKMGAYGKREAERAGRRIVARPVAAVGRGAAALRKYEGAGKIGGRLVGVAGRAGERITAAQQAALKKTYDENFKGMSDDNLALRYATMGADEKVFAAQQLASKGKLNKIDEKILERDIADASTEQAFAKYGGEKAHANFVKVAGRNKDMIDAKKEVDAAGTDVAKKATAEKKYKEVSKKFYESFARKDFEALGTDFYKKGKYGKEALAALLLNEPGAFSKITGGIKNKAELKEFMKQAELIRVELKNGIIEGIRESLKPEDMAKLAKATQGELVAIMKELKAKPQNVEQFNKDTEEIQALEQSGKVDEILKWIEARDAKMFRGIGGSTGLVNLDDQMHLLHARKNAEFMQMDQHEDYQHMLRLQDSMRKSAGRRLYAEGEKEEKKEDKKA